MKLHIPIAATVAVVMTVTSLGVNGALAAPPHAAPPAVHNDASVIQVASKKKHRRVHRGNAAGAAAVMGLFGAIAGMAAQDAYRDRYYDDGYYYRGGPGPYNYAPRYRHHYYGGYPSDGPGALRPGGIPPGNADPYGR